MVATSLQYSLLFYIHQKISFQKKLSPDKLVSPFFCNLLKLVLNTGMYNIWRWHISYVFLD